MKTTLQGRAAITFAAIGIVLAGAGMVVLKPQTVAAQSRPGLFGTAPQSARITCSLPQSFDKSSAPGQRNLSRGPHYTPDDPISY